MNLIRFVIQRKTFVSMLFIGLCLLGIVSYEHLPTELLPAAELPMLFVRVTSRREVNPDYFEKKAIIPLEGAIGTLENIDRIESSINRRQGLIQIDYNENADIKFAYLKLTERINAVRQTIPDEFFVNVVKVDLEQLSNMLMTLQARGSGGVNRVRQVVDEKVVKELENIDGVANVEVTGGRQQTVAITLNEAACEARAITPATIQQALNQYHQNKTFLGYAYEHDKQYFVSLSNEYDSIDDLENIVLIKSDQVRLKDIAEIYVGNKEPETISRVNGKEAVTITLVRDSQINLIEVAHDARAVIQKLNDQLQSDDVEIVIQSDAAEIMEDNLDLIMNLALVGGLLAILVLWFFLHNLRLVLIVALAIPISILAALNLFYAFDISINSLTLVGMALAVGMLLDNSIVVLENIYRLLSRRQPLDQAVIQGTHEVWRSIFAATLTTITVFLPFIFTSNFLIRLLGKHISVSIISTLAVSLIVALFLIPMTVHRILKNQRGYGDYQFNVISQKNRFLQIYTLFLKSAMRFPARTIISTMVIFFISIIAAVALSISVQQEVETEELNLYVSMPQGATLEKTDAVVSELEKKLEDIEEIEDLVTKIFEEEATLTLQFKEDFEEIKKRQLSDIKTDIQEKIRRFSAADVGFDPPQSSTRFRQGGGGGRGQAGLQRIMGIGSQTERVVIKGHDFLMMHVLANDVRALLDEMSSVQRSFLNIADDRPELHLLFDMQAITHFNLSLATIASELATFEEESPAGVQYKIGTEEYDIMIKNEDLEERTGDDLRMVAIPTNTGGTVDLNQISQLLYTSGAAGVNRVNQEKQIEISYRFLNEVVDSKELLEAGRQEVDQLVQALEIPAGIAVEVIHDETDYSEFYFLIGTAFILIYMILASVFESLLTPLVMMFTIPLAAIGSFWALIFTDNSLFNANTLIGFLILLGVVVNNGIILIDYTRILRQRGYSMQRALITAGQGRIRPILITTITTIVAMFPLAMGQAEYVARVGAPFAITVIGGLALSSLFTLVFIPTAYSGLESALEWWKKLPWLIKALQIIAVASGFVIIYYNIDSLIWRFANAALLLIVIPALTYFLRTSLRRASTKLIPANEPITIRLRNLVKIYDADSRFVREWKQGARQNRHTTSPAVSEQWHQFRSTLYWKLPLLGFLIYFVYFYLGSLGWFFILVHLVYFSIIWLMQPIFNYLGHHVSPNQQKWLNRITAGFVWGFPLANAVLFYFRGNNLAVSIIIGLFWFISLLIYHTANRLHRHKVKIDALTGKLVGIRRNFYLFVKIIPLIGRRKHPFMALKGVSYRIQKGMFGLLGPNGAGKTTLMRLICGVLELNRGTITINDINLAEKREELQSLIGYLPQEFGTYENLTAYQFLDYQAMLKGISEPAEREKVVNYVLGAVHLTEKRHDKIGSFSGGMRQRVGIAQTLLHLPRILVVDEPTAGLDPRERIRFRNLLVELSRERIVVFSTHIIEDISSSCNQLAVLDNGECKYLGTPEDMAQQARGIVWQVLLEEPEFERIRKDLWIVHHIRTNGKIRVRFLATQSPFATAEAVLPTLEDAYLWLLGRDKARV